MEKAEARRLQPYFVRSFFLKAFDAARRRSATPARPAGTRSRHVPAAIRERDRRLTGRNRREQEPVLKRYDRICFTRGRHPAARQAGPGPRRADAPRPSADAGHADMILEQHANLLRQGAILVDPADDGPGPWLLFLLTHEVKSGDGTCSPRRMQFVRVGPGRRRAVRRMGAAPRPGAAGRGGTRLCSARRAGRPLDSPTRSTQAVALAAATLVPEHFREVAGRRIAHVEKTLAAVHDA